VYKYGLKYDDILRESPQVLEALKRLPEAELVARDQRLKRAFDLSQKKEILPVEKRMTDAFNTPYLRPVVEEVEKEELERKAWRV
jgi:ubiquinol-cytochrome c reductase subunit 7